MSKGSALRAGAAAAATVSGPVAARRRPPTLSPTEQLQRLSSRLDELIRDVSHGATSHRQVECRIAEAEAIAGELRAVFRGSAAAEHPPLWQQGGKAAW